MTNRCYLSCSNSTEIYPSFSDAGFNVETQWIDQGAGCLPLIWLPLFTDKDLVTTEFNVDGERFFETAPIVERIAGINNLNQCRSFINELFSNNGGLNHHIDLFASFLQGLEGKYLTIELQEIGWLYGKAEFDVILRRCLELIRARDVGAKEELVELSTVLVDRMFLKLEQLDYDKCEAEDRWNFHRIMGEQYIREIPW
jgi:hypothetical protein